ncbi:thermonuclease family protein [Altererythrobacter aquiaggeris]|uniref:thermonuclease family protein n=1 Tax=Aestuarierythrobacter aquiaggeris TaxID=1898396 RepID=UPI003018998A
MGKIVPFRRQARSKWTGSAAYGHAGKQEDIGWLTPLNMLLFAALPLGVFTAVFMWGAGPPGEASEPIASSENGGTVVTAKFSKCAFGSRSNCIVDGDTIWYRGEKIRIADIDTPEVGNAGCDREKSLGDQATDRMQALLNEGSFTLTRPPGTPNRDRYDRLLRVAERGGVSVGDVLVDEGLAEEWGGKRIAWCG